MTIGFDLCRDLDLKFSRSNIEFAISQPKIFRLPRNEKQTYLLNSKASNVTIRFDLDHNLDLWIFKVKFDLWPHTWLWPWIFMVKFWNSCISEWEGWLTLHKGGGSRSFMTMTMTIWWPRSGVWIYPIVTGVTSVVGVPSTHLVLYTIACHIRPNYNGTRLYLMLCQKIFLCLSSMYMTNFYSKAMCEVQEVQTCFNMKMHAVLPA